MDDPAVAAARKAQREVQLAARTLIAALHWRDFEILCDLIFARLGWQRLSDVGGEQKDTDLVLIQPATGERAFVQVKSKSSQRELSSYEQSFQANPGFERMFYVCHSYKGEPALSTTGKPVHFWHGDEVARLTIAAGLFDWLLERAR
jgi:hypothetical protein